MVQLTSSCSSVFPALNARVIREVVSVQFGEFSHIKVTQKCVPFVVHAHNFACYLIYNSPYFMHFQRCQRSKDEKFYHWEVTQVKQHVYICNELLLNKSPFNSLFTDKSMWYKYFWLLNSHMVV